MREPPPLAKKMTNLLDSYLLFRIKARRDPEAFAQLYDRYVEQIYRFVFLKLPTAEEAQDVTSETFTRVWGYLIEQKEIINFRALLYRIARNLIADHYRKAQDDLSIQAVTFSEDSTSTLMQDLGDAGQNAELMAARAEIALISSKLERLKEGYRDVLMLRLIDQLPFAVIAEILDKKVGHVRVVYHRALKALQELDQPNS